MSREKPGPENENKEYPWKIESDEDFVKILLNDLGLEWKDLENKEILDLGAGLAILAKEAQKRGIKITSLEKHPDQWEEDGEISKDTPYLVGDAECLPFKNKAFKLIISRAAPPITSNTKREVERVIQEAKRILKEGGEFRFGPGNLSAVIFKTRELFTPEEEKKFTREERIARIREKTLEYLKSLDSNITEHQIEGSEDEVFGHYYKLAKQERTIENFS